MAQRRVDARPSEIHAAPLEADLRVSGPEAKRGAA